MSSLSAFVFDNEYPVRSLMRDGEPWFVGTDLCRALGYSRARNAYRMLDDDERATEVIESIRSAESSAHDDEEFLEASHAHFVSPKQASAQKESGPGDRVDSVEEHLHGKGADKRSPLVQGSFQRGGGAQETVLINEPGVYRLIVNSRIPSARRFQRWLYHEVLPQVRKTGAYAPKIEDHYFDQQKQLRERATNIRLVEVATRLNGKAAGRKLWAELGLPAIEEPGPTVRAREVVNEGPAPDPELALSILMEAYGDLIAEGPNAKNSGLSKVGLGWVKRGRRTPTLAVAARNKSLDRVYAGTPFAEIGYASALASLNGAVRSNGRIAGRPTHCVLLPLALVGLDTGK